ncbi:MAG: methyltransferase [Bacteroidota bacterium]
MKNQKAKFCFKKFEVLHALSSMKVGTDAVLLGAWTEAGDSCVALDVGTGSGIIALMLAQRFPKLTITGIDIHDKSVTEAGTNFSNSPWPDRLQAKCLEVAALQEKNYFDLLVSNPPFFDAGSTPPDMDRSRARHTSSLSYKSLIEKSYSLLKEEGSLAVIIPYLAENRFQEKTDDQGFYLKHRLAFRPKKGKPIERVLLQYSKSKPTRVTNSELIHYLDNGDWTDDYKFLTKDFHLKL